MMKQGMFSHNMSQTKYIFILNESGRTIRVNLPENKGTIILDNIPDDILCSALISRIAAIPILSEKNKLIGISINGKKLSRIESVDQDEIDIFFIEKKSNMLSNAFFSFLFILIHTIPIVLYKTHHRLWQIILKYVLVLYLLIILCIIFKLEGQLFHFGNHQRMNHLLEIPILFFRSLLPNFRLEQVLIRENN